MNEQPTERRPRRRAETRAQVLAAARALFVETGIAGVTVEAICARAGYTRGAFYSNFTSIDDVLLALHLQTMGGLIETLETAVGAPSDGVTDVDHALATILDLLPFDPDWHAIRVGFAARARREPELARVLRELNDRLRERLTPLVVAAVERTGRSLVVDRESFVRALVAAYEGGLAAGLLDDHGLQTRAVAVRAVILGLTSTDERTP